MVRALRSSGIALVTAALWTLATVAAAQFHAHSPSLPVNTDSATDTRRDFAPRIEGDGAGNWVTVWFGDPDGAVNDENDILVARSTNGGATWSAPALLDPTATGDNQSDTVVDLATNQAGVWVATWLRDVDMNSSFSGGVPVAARSVDNGATWSAPLMINGSQISGAPAVATDTAGNWVIVFENNTDDIYAVRSSNNAVSWSVPTLVNSNALTDPVPTSDTEPLVVTDGAGNWLAAWSSTSALGNTIGNDQDILVARSSNNGATWSTAAPLNANAATDARDDATPGMATDAAGNWIAVWMSINLANNAGDVYIARSANNGTSWSSPQGLSAYTPVSGLFLNPSIVTDYAGNWVTSWANFNSPNVFVSRSSDNGATWSARETVNSFPEATGSLILPAHVSTDGAGIWMAAWQTSTTFGGDTEIYYSRWTGILAPDRDGDNLSDTDEGTAGTDPDDWDTDGDGLGDNRELTVHGTNPLNADTDGDGVPDDTEIFIGTDPNDPFDFPTAVPLYWPWIIGSALAIVALVARRRKLKMKRAAMGEI